MGRNQERTSPSFFKVLMDDFAHKLRIPKAFVDKYLRGKVPENCVLKTKYGRSWNVTIDESGSNYYCLVNGWLEFVKYHKLRTGDFLVFWLLGGSTFRVAIYGPSCCEKELHLPLSSNIPDIKSEQSEEDSIKGNNPRANQSRKPRDHVNNVKLESDDEYVANTDHPWFVIVLKKSHKYRICVPARFLREAGIAGKRSTVLRDEQGRVWAAELRVWSNNSTVHLIDGWSDLRSANNLVSGDSCLFKFMRSEGNLIQVQVLEKGVQKRGRGRPPRRC